MKRYSSVLAPAGLALGILSGCGTTKPPPELLDARAAYQRAQSGPAAQANRAGIMEARQALDAAETEFNQYPSSDDVKTLAYVAQRKAESAEADGRAAVAWSQQQQAEKMYLQIQAAAAQSEAERERQAAGTSERRAKVALERLGLEAKDEARGTVITLPGAGTFASNKAEILPEARKRLTELAEAVKQVLAEGAPEDVTRKLMLIGYTDDVGSEQHNMALSERRAKAVRAFFAEHGIDPTMMETEGRGEADPIAPNATREGRAENRRVEIVIAPRGGESTTPTPPPTGEPSKGAEPERR